MKRLSAEHVNTVVTRSRALSDATRVRILDALTRGDRSVGALVEAIGAEPSSVSKHLQVLFHAGLVERRRQGSAVIYSCAAPGVGERCRYLAAPKLAAATRDR